MKGRIAAITIAFILLAALVYMSDAGKVLEILLSASPYYIAIALGIVGINTIVRTVRWRYLLSVVGARVGFIDAMKILVASIGISNLTPGKSGDPIRSVLLKKVTGRRVGNTLPSLLIERALDIAAMITISVFGLALLSSTSQITNWIMAAIGVYVVIFAVGIVVLSSEKRTKWMVGKIFRILSFIPKIRNLEHKMDRFASSMHKSFLLYNKKRIILFAGLLSLVVWLVEGIVLWTAFSALGLTVTPIAAITIVSAGTLIAVLTFLPGGLGSGEIITVVFFTALFGLAIADVTATALLTRFLGFWLYVAIGGLFALTMKYKYSV